MSQFGQRLKETRKFNKLSQKELGAQLGIGQTTVANYEKGLRFPNTELLAEIASLLATTVDYLLGRVDTPHGISQSLDMAQTDIAEMAQELQRYILLGEEEKAMRMVMSLNLELDQIQVLFEKVFKTVLYEIGGLWEQGLINVAMEHYATAIVHQMILSLSEKYFVQQGYRGVAVTLAANPDSHTIGIIMITQYLKLLGYKTFYLGHDIPMQSLIEMLIEKKPQVMALSATLDSHINSVRMMIQSIRRQSKLKNMKIIVGGQAFYQDHELWQKVGADAISYDFESLKQCLKAMAL